MKKLKRTQLLDKAHVYTVRTLMGITVAGCFVLGSQIWNYYRNVRPTKLEDRHRIKSEEIALEQQEKEAELMRRQKEAESFVKY